MRLLQRRGVLALREAQVARPVQIEVVPRDFRPLSVFGQGAFLLPPLFRNIPLALYSDQELFGAKEKNDDDLRRTASPWAHRPGDR